MLRTGLTPRGGENAGLCAYLATGKRPIVAQKDVLSASLPRIKVARLLFLCLFLASPAAPAQYPTRFWMNIGEFASLHLVVPENASASLLFGAQLFQKYWKTCTGLPVTLSNKNEGAVNVWLGREITPTDLLPRDEMETLLPSEYIVKTYIPELRDAQNGARKQLVLTGYDDQAALDAMFVFLRHAFDIRWLAPGVVGAPPARGAISPLTVRRSPAFRYRFLLDAGLTKNDDATREFLLANHLPTIAPEWLSVPTSEARFFCARPEALRALADEVVEHLGRYAKEKDPWRFGPRREILSLWHAGYTLGCTCDYCRTQADTDHHDVDAAIAAANAVAERLGNSPYAEEIERVLVLLPPKYRQPPSRLTPHPRVTVLLSAADTDAAMPLRRQPTSRQFMEAVKAWTRLTEKVWVLEEMGLTACPILPWPKEWVVPANFQWYDQQHIEGVIVLGRTHSESPFIDAQAWRVFLYSSLLWDPDESVDRLLQRFCEGYYGEAASEAQAYLRSTYAALQRTKAALSPTMPKPWWDAAWLEENAERFSALEQRTLPDVLQQRLNELRLPFRLAQCLGTQPNRDALDAVRLQEWEASALNAGVSPALLQQTRSFLDTFLLNTPTQAP